MKGPRVLRHVWAILAVLASPCCVTDEPRQSLAGPVRTSSGTLYVTAAGQGPDMVLLHGLGDSGVGWHKIEGALREAGYRVTVPDALGAGRSDKNLESDLSLSGHTRRLAEVLDLLEIDHPILVGNSLGGSVALEPMMKIMGPRLLAYVGLRLNYFDASQITPDDLDIYAAEASRPGTIEAFLHQQQQLRRDMEGAQEWTRDLPRITCPTLILWGTGDRILPLAQAHRLASALPNARLVWLDDVGHTPQLEAPERVIEEILGFLELRDG